MNFRYPKLRRSTWGTLRIDIPSDSTATIPTDSRGDYSGSWAMTSEDAPLNDFQLIMSSVLSRQRMAEEQHR